MAIICISGCVLSVFFVSGRSSGSIRPCKFITVCHNNYCALKASRAGESIHIYGVRICILLGVEAYVDHVSQKQAFTGGYLE